jgi:hypothetical protein
MPYDGTTFDPDAAEDLRLLQLTLASLRQPGGHYHNFTNDRGGKCIIRWLSFHAGEPRYDNTTGRRIAEQRLYPVLPYWRICTGSDYSDLLGSREACAVMAFNDTSSAWRVRRMLRRAIRRLETERVI